MILSNGIFLKRILELLEDIGVSARVSVVLVVVVSNWVVGVSIGVSVVVSVVVSV